MSLGRYITEVGKKEPLLAREHHVWKLIYISFTFWGFEFMHTH